MPWDADLAEIADMLNVGGGAHAGSAEISRATVDLAKARGLAWGLHPGYPDPVHFGRRGLTHLDFAAVRASLQDQVKLLMDCGAASYLKPHGAFYHDSQLPGAAADLLQECLEACRLPLVGFPGTHHASIAVAGFWTEAFAERGYGADGHLLPRDQPGALLSGRDEIQAQCRALRADTICVHGDSPGCVEIIRWVREVFPR